MRPFAKVFPFAMLLTLGILKTSFRLHSLTRNIATCSFLIATNLPGKARAEGKRCMMEVFLEFCCAQGLETKTIKTPFMR